MAIIRPGVSPAGTLESAASLTVVESQPRRTPRWGSTTSVVWLPEVIVPLATITALPCETSSAPVTLAAASGFLLSSATMAMGAASVATAFGSGAVCAHKIGAAIRAASNKQKIISVHDFTSRGKTLNQIGRAHV